MATESFEIARIDHFASFERQGESEVRVNLERWKDGSKIRYRYAQEWIRLIDEKRSLDASFKRDAREEETLSIAKEANLIASRALEISERQATEAARASRYAMYAAIVAVIALIASNKDSILSSLGW